MSKHKHPFESWLSVGVEYLDGVLENPPLLPWPEFWLNPRRLRGSDFLMRWSQGLWSEKRIMKRSIKRKNSSQFPTDRVERRQQAVFGNLNFILNVWRPRVSVKSSVPTY